jgi:flagellar motility protein MotE (MotC chaperone)
LIWFLAFAWTCLVRLPSRDVSLDRSYVDIDKSRQDQQKISQETRAKLIKTFEKMQPKKAAAIISNMEDDLAVDLLKSLKEKNVALIFESMAPDRVTVLSSKIAEQKPAVSSAQEEIKGKVPAGKASP